MQCKERPSSERGVTAGEAPSRSLDRRRFPVSAPAPPAPRRHCWDPDGLRGESANPWGLFMTALLIRSTPMSTIIKFLGLLKPSHSRDKLTTLFSSSSYLAEDKEAEGGKSIFYYLFTRLKGRVACFKKKDYGGFTVHCEKYYFTTEISNSTRELTYRVFKLRLLFYLNSTGLSGTYFTILGNQAPERRESKTVLGFYLKGEWQRHCPAVESGQKIAGHPPADKGASQD